MFGTVISLTATAVYAEELNVASVGGAVQDTQRVAFFEPTAKALNIKINEFTTSSLQEVRVQVESGSVSWDIVEMSGGDCAIGAPQGLFEKLDYNVIKADGIEPKLVHEDWVGVLYYSTVMAWNTDTIGSDGKKPETWADFFDTEKFPGTRAVLDHPQGNLEIALLADGVAPDKVYPLDVERAFKKMEQLKPHIGIWWTSGAQSAQIAKDGEADLFQIWNARLSAAVGDGARAAYTYNQGLMMADCLVIPKGAPNKDLAMKALAMFLAPEQQANFAKRMDYGPINAPINAKAFDTGILNDEDRKRLNSSPENAAAQVIIDNEWWGVNGAALMERWQNFKQQ